MLFLKKSLIVLSVLLLGSAYTGVSEVEAVENTSHYFLLTVENETVQISARNRDGSLDKTYEGLVSMKTVPPIRTMLGKIYFSKYDEGVKYFITPPVEIPTQVLMVDEKGAFGQALLSPPPVSKEKPAPRQTPPQEETEVVTKEDPKIFPKEEKEEKEEITAPKIEPVEPTVILDPEVEKEKLPSLPILKPSAQKEPEALPEVIAVEEKERSPSRMPIRKPATETKDEIEESTTLDRMPLNIRRSPIKEVKKVEEENDSDLEKEKTEDSIETKDKEEETEINTEDELTEDLEESTEVAEKEDASKKEESIVKKEENDYSEPDIITKEELIENTYPPKSSDRQFYVDFGIKILFIILITYFLISYGLFLYKLKKNIKKLLILLISFVPLFGTSFAADYYFDLEDSDSEITVSAKNLETQEIDTDYIGTVRVKTIPQIDYIGSSFVFGIEDKGVKKFLKPQVSVPTQIIFLDMESAYGQGVFYPTIESSEEIQELSFPEGGTIIAVKKEVDNKNVYKDDTEDLIMEITPDLIAEVDSILLDEGNSDTGEWIIVAEEESPILLEGQVGSDLGDDNSLVMVLTQNKDFYSNALGSDLHGSREEYEDANAAESVSQISSPARVYSLILTFLFFFLASIVFVAGVMVYFFHKKEKQVHLWPIMRVPFASFVLLGLIFFFFGEKILSVFGV